MSVTHTVTIHCDRCGHWVHAERRDVTKLGWTRWKEGRSSMHHCPSCTVAVALDHTNGSEA